MTRSDEGEALGFLRVSEARGEYRGSSDLARPVGWSDREEAEAGFAAAEEVRLLYVAVTRAKEELVVSRWPEGRGTSAWSPLDAWLDEHAEVLELDPGPPAEREELPPEPERVRAAVDEAARSLAEGSRATYTHGTVTSVAKERPTGRARPHAAPGEVEPGRSEMRGFSWGSAVHGALALAASASDGEVLRSGCRDLLVEHQRPLDERGEPLELSELLELVRSVRGSEIWKRAHAADRKLVEVPFAVANLESTPESEPEPSRLDDAGAPGGRRQLDLFGSAVAGADASDSPSSVNDAAAESEKRSAHDDGDVPTVLEGVIDLAFREPKGWVIVDYKTDVGTDPEFEIRARGYRRQVDLYGRAWARLTGERVLERVLFYTAQGRVESW